MENLSKEKKRAANIIWNASESYSFQPDFEGYDGKGEAELYRNYIFGAVRKYYDYARLQQFFSDLSGDPDHVFFESLAWIGLENCAYEKGRKERPVLEDLRKSYARKVLRKEEPASFYYLVDEIKTAHFQRVLGEEIVAREQVLDILDGLEFPESLDAEQIITRMNKIIDTYFPLNIAARKRRFIKSLFPRNRKIHLGINQSTHYGNPFQETPILSLFSIDSVEVPGEKYLLAKNEKRNGKISLWQDLKDQWQKKQRETIQNYYGVSILPESQVKALERILCVENHRNCHLHFTRGEFHANTAPRAGAANYQEAAVNQREKNKAHFKENIARNSTSIEKLTNVIRNTLLVDLQASQHRAKAGSLVAGKVWRNLYLYDDKVFLKDVLDEIGNLTVDILLDASGSQMDRQEVIATQGFIIAESLTRCQIPVKVYSFCTNRNFTVINLFRDYGEVNKNDMIFHYHASGCNRDGLAVRTALHMIEKSPAEHKIMIVLSDGKPLDPNGIPGSGFDPDQYIYADAPAVNDTAMEVRKGWRSGVSILCVFTGSEDDIPAAKKMYGKNMVCIQSPERFADIVGILIRNIFTNL